MQRLRLSLEGLSVGDAFGERFFGAPFLVARWLTERALPEAPWRYTDDTEMALGICEVLSARGAIDVPRDYEAALWRTVSGLGDRDTTCAIVGGIVALSAGGVPPAWLAARERLG
jgi:ADP-ribosylglycohydrolase